MAERHDQGGAQVVKVSVRGGEICIAQQPGSGNLGTSVWDASVILVHYLNDNSKQFNQRTMDGKRVLELGAGCGLAGIYCATLGADVTLTDLEPVLPILNQNARRNLGGMPESVKYKVQEYCWGNPVDALDAPYDYIIACDCVYVESLVEVLVWSLEQLAGASTTVVVCRHVHTSKLVDLSTSTLLTIPAVRASCAVRSYRSEHADLLFCKRKRNTAAPPQLAQHASEGEQPAAALHPATKSLRAEED
ncbi:putative methyltransferase-domain-containing protein [Tribonema minus]|uniref:Putative methyltransferase-domain-containing protein n=1 Tax=Tribonema minus TaxID=303371 RepID=A0A835YRK7_9STRA|nr:putative methyltransferase-domain-containing protein [Tribonema minus]